MLPRGRPSWLSFADVIFAIRQTGLRALVPQAGHIYRTTVYYVILNFYCHIKVTFDPSSYIITTQHHNPEGHNMFQHTELTAQATSTLSPHLYKKK
jgi:hypothetical protein